VVVVHNPAPQVAACSDRLDQILLLFLERWWLESSEERRLSSMNYGAQCAQYNKYETILAWFFVWKEYPNEKSPFLGVFGRVCSLRISGGQRPVTSSVFKRTAADRSMMQPCNQFSSVKQIAK
jgi:hypothetical protein